MLREQAQLLAASQAKLSALSFFCSMLYYVSSSVPFCTMYLFFLLDIVLCIFFCSILYYVSFSVPYCTMYLFLLDNFTMYLFPFDDALCTFLFHVASCISFCSTLYNVSFSVPCCTMYLFLFHVVLCTFFCSMLHYILLQPINFFQGSRDSLLVRAPDPLRVRIPAGRRESFLLEN